MKGIQIFAVVGLLIAASAIAKGAAEKPQACWLETSTSTMNAAMAGTGIRDTKVWRQQPGSPGYLKNYDIKGVRGAPAKATAERPPEWRATPNSPGTYESPA